MGGEHASCAAEAGDDLVGDEQDVVTGEYFLQSVVVVGRRDDDSACAKDGLADERRDGVGTLCPNDLLQAGDQVVREAVWRLAGRLERVQGSLMKLGSGRPNPLCIKSRPVAEAPVTVVPW